MIFYKTIGRDYTDAVCREEHLHHRDMSVVVALCQLLFPQRIRSSQDEGNRGNRAIEPNIYRRQG